MLTTDDSLVLSYLPPHPPSSHIVLFGMQYDDMYTRQALKPVNLTRAQNNATLMVTDGREGGNQSE